MDLGELPNAARDDFLASATRDAQDCLDGKLSPIEFAGSVWYAAGTAALALNDGRSHWMEPWLRFAHWEDELDAAKSADQAVRVRISGELRKEALALLGSLSE